jgi:hypothetical protein
MGGKSGKIKLCGLFLFIGLMALTGNVFAQYDINVLKAAYIERITRFVDWPQFSFPSASDSIVFGIINDDKFEKSAIEIFKSQKIKDRPVKIIRVNNAKDMVLCHLCYIGKINRDLLDNFIKQANQEKILLFGNTSDYANLGVHINFYIEDNKLKFEINKNSVDDGGFKISHLLMKTARII